MATFADSPIGKGSMEESRNGAHTSQVLIATPLADGQTKYREIAFYLSAGLGVTVDISRLPTTEQAVLERQFASHRNGVKTLRLRTEDDDALLRAFSQDGQGFSGIVFSYPYFRFDAVVLQQILHRQSDLSNRLRFIAVANDSFSHLKGVVDLAKRSGIQVMTTNGVHAQDTAEYTLLQFGKYVRRLDEFATDFSSRRWRPNEAVDTTHSLHRMSLAVLGASGKDGRAVASAALGIGMKVYAAPSRDAESNRALTNLGVMVTDCVETALAQADLVSVNLRVSDETRYTFDQRYFGQLRPQTIIVSAAGCEIFDYASLVDELKKSDDLRRLRKLVVDMPYGGDCSRLFEDDRNIQLMNLGVEFTPRIAGYTVEAFLGAAKQIAHQVAQLNANVQVTEVVTESNHQTTLENVVARCLLEAGKMAIHLRQQGLVIVPGSGAVVTNADQEVASFVQEYLTNAGFGYDFAGEELGDLKEQTERQWLVDAIDGTRNFRDGNYGWCLSVALLNKGRTVLGFVHDPITQTTYMAKREGGAFTKGLGEQTWSPLRVHASLPEDFSFTVGSYAIRQSHEKARQLAESINALGGRERLWGSVALSICAVARGGLAAYVQGSSYVHDHAAALLIAAEAGANICQCMDPTSGRSDLVVSHPLLSRQIEQLYRKIVVDAAAPRTA